MAAPCAVGDFQFSCRKVIVEWRAIGIAPDIFQEIHVKGPGRIIHRYRLLPEMIEAVEENNHQHLYRVGSFQLQGGEPYRLSV